MVQTYWQRPVIFVSDETDNANIGKVRDDSEMFNMKWREHTRQVTFIEIASHRRLTRSFIFLEGVIY